MNNELMDTVADAGYIVSISPCKNKEEEKCRSKHFHQTTDYNAKKNDLSSTSGPRMTFPMHTLNTTKTGEEIKAVTIKDIRLLCRRYMERNLKYGVNRSLGKKDVRLIREKVDENKGSDCGRRSKIRYQTSISVPKRKKHQQEIENMEYQQTLHLNSKTLGHEDNAMLDAGNDKRFSTGQKDIREHESILACCGMKDKNRFALNENYFKRDVDCMTTDDFLYKHEHSVNQAVRKENLPTRFEESDPLKYYYTSAKNKRDPCEHVNSYEDREGCEGTEKSRKESLHRKQLTKGYTVTIGLYDGKRENKNEDDEPRRIRTDHCNQEFEWKRMRQCNAHDITQLYKEERKEIGYFKQRNGWKDGDEKFGEYEENAEENEEEDDANGGDGEEVEEDEEKEGYEGKEGQENISEISSSQDCDKRKLDYNFEEEECENGSIHCFHVQYGGSESYRAHHDPTHHYACNSKDADGSESECCFEDLCCHEKERTYDSEDFFQEIYDNREGTGESESECSVTVYEYQEETEHEYDSALDQSYGASECDCGDEVQYELEEKSEEVNSFLQQVHILRKSDNNKSDHYYPEQKYKCDRKNQGVRDGGFHRVYSMASGKENERPSSLQKGYSIRRHASDHKDAKDHCKNSNTDLRNMSSFLGEELYDNYLCYKRNRSTYNSSERENTFANGMKGYLITQPSKCTSVKESSRTLNFM